MNHIANSNAIKTDREILGKRSFGGRRRSLFLPWLVFALVFGLILYGVHCFTKSKRGYWYGSETAHSNSLVPLRPTSFGA